uniref:Adenylate kinase isoenzyme 6 homolog n=1 Tax=Nelumbo nucifera TaxID=4432 RepID=A0A822Z8M9_NELNU|nr:TPA_asm: hypothetical protein HUJ06_014138 [Nelumbo nucifera]
MAQNSRKKPNILVTGTPGTGKTTTSSLLADATQLRRINVGELVKEKNLHQGWDDEFDCHVIDEDLVRFKILTLDSVLSHIVLLNYASRLTSKDGKPSRTSSHDNFLLFY